MRGARAALAFLTRLPAGRLESADFARAPAWFGIVGLLIGVVQAVIFIASSMVWPPVIAAILAVAGGLLLTGALHEDGLADTWDGLGSGQPKARALDIMRDSRIGSYGTLALIVALGLRVGALAAMGPVAPWVLIAGQGASRAAMSLMLRAGPYLRTKGAGTGMTGPLGMPGLVVLAIAFAAAFGLVGWSAGAYAVLAGGIGLTVGAMAVRQWALRRLDGLTGDILGAAQVTGDIGFLLGVLACL